MKRPTVSAGSATDRGRVRARNEDAAGGSLEGPVKLYAVADGLGGLADGHLASRLALDVLLERFAALPGGAERRLAGALREANARLHAANLRRALPMATTLTACALDGASLAAAHVGDSRLYRLRRGRLERLTEDHAVSRHGLTRAVGTEAAVEVDSFTIAVEEGDAFLLCTDGLHGVVPEATIARLAARGTPDEACAALVAEADRLGSPDNVTLWIVRTEGTR